MSPAFHRDQLGFGLLLSIGLHVLLGVLIIFWPGFGSSKYQLYAPAYRVNLVGPPKLPSRAPASRPVAKRARPKAKPTAAKPKARPKPKPKAKPKEAIATKVKKAKTTTKKAEKKTTRIKREKKRARAETRELDRTLKHLQSKLSEQHRLDRALSKLQQRVGSRVQAKSSGIGPSRGATSSQLRLRYQLYYNELWERIQRHWILPELLVQKSQGLMAVIAMRITRDGRIQRIWLEKGSGNQRFDASCIRAVEKAAPFPPLPAGMGGRTHELGVRFSPEGIG